MNTPQVQVPMVVSQQIPFSQPSLPTGNMGLPSILNLKSENCTGIFDLVKKYWWVLLLLVLAFLYYRRTKSKKDEEEVQQPSSSA